MERFSTSWHVIALWGIVLIRNSLCSLNLFRPGFPQMRRMGTAPMMRLMRLVEQRARRRSRQDLSWAKARSPGARRRAWSWLYCR